MTMMHELSERHYRDDGNLDVVALVDPQAVTILDVGCGAGDNAALLRARDPSKRVYGITLSHSEAEVARGRMQACWVADVEQGLPAEALARAYDLVVFSHVLEHLRDPATVVARCVELLQPGGYVLIAVPNIAHWRQRWDFLRGDFEYHATGPMDVTHLRFLSYHTAERFLLARVPELQVTHKSAPGSVPLWLLRRHALSANQRARIDAWGSRHWPNLFGSQVLIKARKP